MRIGLTPRVVLGGAAVLAVVIGTFVTLIRAVDSLQSASHAAQRTGSIVADVNELERRVVDLETGQRGYVITHEQRFLAPTRAAAAAIPPLEEQLQAAVPPGTREAATLADIVRRIQSYQRDWLAPVVTAARRDPKAADALVATGQGKQRVDAIRSDFNTLRIALDVQSRSRAAAVDDRRSNAVVLALAGLTLTALLILLYVLYLDRLVTAPVRRIAAAAKRLRVDPGARAPEGGAGEVALLAASFNEAAAARAELDQLKTEFLGLVSHELRTPLTAIGGYVELLVEDEEVPAEQRASFLQAIDRNAKRLERLVGDLLLVSQIEAGRFALERTHVDLAQLVTRAVESAEAAFGTEKVSVSTELPASLPPVDGDPVRLAQVLDNLVSNAIKYTPEGGAVFVRAEEQDGTVVVDVADTGIGIPADEQQHLFERFFRSSISRESGVKGTGLGLAIAKALVEAHGGTLSFESAPGRGTTFTVALPAT